MRAAVIPHPGGPEVFQITDVPLGALIPGYARVQIEFSAINAADLWTRRPGVVSKYPHIPGSDGCGILIETNGYTGIEIGARVVINPALQLPSGRRSWDEPLRDIVDILGYSSQGTCAEYCDVPIENVFPAPEHLDPQQAAAIPLTFLTAWRMLVTRGRLAHGESVLIWGASGGLGSAAVVLANHLGARVIAAAGNAHDADVVSGLGVLDVIRYDQGEIPDQVSKAAGGQVDLVFDSVAGSTWADSLKSLRPGGRIVLAGTSAGDVVTHDLSDFFYYQWTLLGCRMGDEGDFAAMLHAVRQGALQPVIGKTLPLSKISEAHQAMEDGQHVGKIVLNNAE